MNAEIENMVMRANLGCPLELDRISRSFEGSEYDPDKFPCMIYRMEDVRIAVLLFASGNLVITGARDLESAGKAFKKIKDRIGKMGFSVDREAEPVVQDLVISGDLGGKLDLGKINLSRSIPSAEYDPEGYPGLIVNLEDGRMKMILLPSGKAVITGGTDLESMSRELEKMEEIVSNDQ